MIFKKKRFVNNKSQARLLKALFGFIFVGIILGLYFISASSVNYPTDNRTIGFEYLNSSGYVVVSEAEADVVHIWNTEDDYFFNKSSGTQWTNYFQSYWTQNVFCGTYELGNWFCLNDTNLFTWDIITDNETYVSYSGEYYIKSKKLTLSINYSLNLNDENLSIGFKAINDGPQPISDLGFIWKIKDIKIGGNSEGDLIYLNDSIYDEEGNDTSPNQNITSTVFNLSNITDTLTFTNMNESYYSLFDDNGFVKLYWNNSVDYTVEVENVSGQDNAEVTLLMKIGTLGGRQSISRTLYWRDPITFSSNASGETADLWDVPLVWQHDITCGENMELIVGVATDHASENNISTITYNGTSLSKIGRALGTDVEVELWNLTDPDCGTPLWVNVTWLIDTVDEGAGMSIVYYGVDTINLSSLDSSSGSGSGASSLSILSSSEDNWVVNVFSLDVDPGASISVSGDNATQRGFHDEGSAITVAIADGNDSDGEVTMAWSGFNDEWVQIGVELIPNDFPSVLLNTSHEAVLANLTPTLQFTGYDNESDEIEYNLQVDTIDSFNSLQIIADNYSESNQDGTTASSDGLIGQSFTGNGESLVEAILYIKNAGTTGDINCQIFAHSGSFGAGTPTGSAIATSENIDSTTIGASYELVNCTFTGDDQIILTEGTNYFVVMNATSVTGSKSQMGFGIDSSSPTHGGNVAYSLSSSWFSQTARDGSFYIYTLGGSPLLDKLSVTPDATFNGTGDPHPWTSGTIINYTVQAGDALSESTTYFWRVKGSDGTYGEWSETRNFTIVLGASDTEYPLFYRPQEEPAVPTTYLFGQSYNFNISINSTNSTVGLDFNWTNYTASNITSVFNVTIPSLPAGNFTYYWWAYGNYSNNNYNVSKAYYYNISKAVPIVNVTINGTQNNITTIQGDTIDLNCSIKTGDSGATILLYNNGSLINNGSSPIGNITTFSAVQYENITCVYIQSQNYTAVEESWWINITSGQCSPIIDQDWVIDDAQVCNGVTETTGTGWINITTGGILHLRGGSNITTTKLNLQTTGDQVFVGSKSELIAG